MSLLRQQEQAAVSAAIADVEQHTDAELVAVVARRADSYYFIPTLWAAILALLTPVVLGFTPLWLTAMDLLVAQWLVFIVLASLFRVPGIKRMLVPTAVAHGRAAAMARVQFVANGLHHTVGGTGVLVFIAEDEHYVEVLADRGISQYVDDSQWQGLVDDLVDAIRGGRVSEGLIAAIVACGELLQQHVPATEAKNELPNHLVVIDD